MQIIQDTIRQDGETRRRFITLEVDIDGNYHVGQRLKIVHDHTDAQVKFFHALCGDIGEQMGETKQQVKDVLKLGAEVESVAEATKEQMSHLIEVTLEFVKEHDITLSEKTVKQMEAEDKYSMCLHKKICLLCAEKADMHHADAVGMGRDRKEHDKRNPGERKIPLCRKHHTELHSMGANGFIEKYHLQGYEKFFRRI